ncbi:MAG: carboxypeptidase regulatory-like domain-containing protein [Prevotella sp.]|nr:carboxypeptidase regulatory-like domain-containing protein [Prevotella sp.]
MKKAKLLLLTLFSVFGINTTWAETMSPYEMDFNAVILTSNHDFTVASNWRHIVGSYKDSWGDTYYMSYSYKNNEGINESGALLAYRQYASDPTSSSSGSTVYDLLVSPVVSGEVKLYVKPSISASSSIPAFVEIYNVDETGSTRGSLIQKFTVDEGFVADDAYEGWYTITLTLSEAQRIGIRAQHVYMDNFSATSAEIVAEQKLTIKTVADVDGASTTYFNQQEDGTILAHYLVTLINSGDVDLAPGDENYTLSLFNRYAPATLYGAFPIPVALAAGQTSEPFEMQVSLPAEQAGWKYWDVKENISGTTKEGKWCGTNLYESKFIFDKAGTSYYNSSSATTTPINFGKVSEATTLNYEIYNPGNAPLTINSFTIDVPFTSTAPTGEFTVAAKEKKAINITFPAAEPGIFNGILTIEYTNYGKEAATYTLNVSGTVVDPSKNLITFDNGKTGAEANGQFPAGSIHPDEVYITSTGNGEDINFYLQCISSSVKKFITPMLTATSGETFTFDAWYSSYKSSSAVIVYTSKDRLEWTQLTKVSSNTLSSTAQTFSATIEEAGDYYLAFELYDNAFLDNIYGLTLAEQPEHNWFIAENNIPTKGKQNNEYTATISLHNINAESDVVETATLYVNGEAVVSVINTDLPGNDKTAAEGTGRTPSMSNIENPVGITLSYKPHTFGTLPAYIELKSGDKVVTTEEVEVTIAEEMTESGIAIGEAKTTNTMVPFYGTWADDGKGLSECDMLYTKDILTAFGLKEGDIINAITFPGTPSASKTFNNLTTEAWVGLLDENATFTPGTADKTNMQYVKIHDAETVTFTEGEAVDFSITLSEPIIWDGTSSIRIATNMNGNGTYLNIKFPADNSYSNSYYSHGGGSYSNANVLPVAYLSLNVEPKTFSGIVIDDLSGQPIEGATVTLCNEENDVVYTDTTNAQGVFTINVVQDALSYTATIEADGYETLVSANTYTFENSVEQNYALTPDIPIVESITTTISDSEYATLYYEGLTLTIPEEVKAYTAKVDGWNIILNEVKDIIPAGTPVIIGGPQGEYTFPIGAPITTETALFDNNTTYGKGAEIGTENVTAVLGNDRTTRNYDLKLSTTKAYCAELFGQTVPVTNEETGEVEQKTRVVYVVGNQNPKDGELEGDKSTGNGYKPDQQNLPQSGTYYMLTPAKDGHITAYIVLNKEKNFYVAKASTGECLPVSDLTLKADGDVPVPVTLNDDFTIDEKMNGTVEFDVTAGETYYLFCTGSKLGFGGYVFTELVIPENDLIGTEDALTISDDTENKYYVLSWKDANKNPEELGFYFWQNSPDGHSMQLGAHKAYLKMPAATASNKGYVFWLPDAIEGVTINALTDADSIYTLSGIRINTNNLKKGIYIVNGKKVIIK